MVSKIVFFVSCVAIANAGVLPAQYTGYAGPAYTSFSGPTLTATADNVYRSAGNLQTISTQSKSVATPFSSSNKHFTSINNPGVYDHVAAVTPGTPVAAVAPVAAVQPVSPVTYSRYAVEPLRQPDGYTAAANYAYAKYTAPVANTEYRTTHLEHSHHFGYSNPTVAYHGPAVANAVAHAAHTAPAIAHSAGLLGVAYSPAVAVSHMTYSSPVGINYSW